MIREFKFRDKAKNRNCWFIGDLRQINGRCWIFPPDEEAGIDKHEVYPETVGQYMDSIDNERPVYEGDILIDDNSNEIMGFVRYGEGMFDIDGECLSDFYTLDGVLTGVTVAGNIHDNKELLENNK